MSLEDFVTTKTQVATKKRWIFMQAKVYEYINIYRNVRKSLPHGVYQVSFGRSVHTPHGLRFNSSVLARLSHIWLFLLSFDLVSWNLFLCYVIVGQSSFIYKYIVLQYKRQLQLEHSSKSLWVPLQSSEGCLVYTLSSANSPQVWAGLR